MKLQVWRKDKTPPAKLLERLDQEAEQELTESRLKADAHRKARLLPDPWPIEAFSAPGEMRTCEHRFLQKMVYGQDDYWCHDCESELSFPQPFGRPKQHVVPVALQKFAWALRYLGPKAVAVGAMRPHVRYDLPDHPHTPPIAAIVEQRDALQEMLGYVKEYEQLALQEGQENGAKALPEGG